MSAYNGSNASGRSGGGAPSVSNHGGSNYGGRPQVQEEIPSVALELEHSLGFTTNSQGIVYHPDPSKSVVVYSCGKLLCLNDLDDPHEQRLLRGHDAPISAIDMAPSGNLIATGQEQSVDGVVYFNLWDYHSCDIKMRVPTPHKGRINCVAFSPDEAMMATTGAEGSLMVWEVSTGNKVATYKDSISNDEARSIAWGEMANSGTRDQRYMMFVAFNTGIRLCCLTFSIAKLAFEMTVKPCQLPGSGGRMGGFVRKYNCCTHVGPDLLCGTSSGDLVVFQSTEGFYRTSLTLSANGVASLVHNPLHHCVFVGGGDGKLRKIEGGEKDWQLMGEVQLEGAIVSMAGSADCHQIVVLTTAGLMYRVLTSNMSFTLATEAPLRGMSDCCLSPDRAELFATASYDGFLRVWDLNTYTVVSQFSLAHGMRVGQAADVPSPTSCTFDPEPGHVVVGWSDGRIRCINCNGARGEVAWTLANGHKGAVHTVAVCPLYIATAGEDSVVRIWSHATKDLTAQLQDHKLKTSGVHIDNTTSSIVHTYSMDMSLLAYDLSKMDTHKNVKAPKQVAMHSFSGSGGFTCATQRTDNEHELIVGTMDGSILVYDLDYPEPVLTLKDANRVRVTATQVSPDGKHLAVGLADGSLIIYRFQQTGGDKADMQLMLQAVCHSGAVTRCCWTADGKQIVSAGNDGELIIWNFYARH